jgi:hypothetical protein
MIDRNRPAGIAVLSLVFVFGALLCAACGIALLFPAARSLPLLGMIPALAIMGTEAVSWLVFVCLACVVAAFGLWRCSYWGFMLAAVVVFLFVAIHLLRALHTNNWWGLLATVTVGAPVMLYLRKRVRAFEVRTVEPYTMLPGRKQNLRESGEME